MNTIVTRTKKNGDGDDGDGDDGDDNDGVTMESTMESPMGTISHVGLVLLGSDLSLCVSFGFCRMFCLSDTVTAFTRGILHHGGVS